MKSILTICLLGLSIASFSQTIEQKNNRFYLEGRLLAPKEMVNMMSDNPDALKLAKSANSSYGVSNVLGFVGGFLIGFPIGTAIGGGEPEWGMAVAGAGIIVVALPIISSANKKMSKAVDLYNGSESSASSKLDFQLKGNALGLVFKF